MRAELIAVGTELTTGRTLNTNSAELSRQLQALNIICSRQHTVADDPAAIVDIVRQALGRADLVIVTGGLGPTLDDLTMDAVAHAVGSPMQCSPQIKQQIEAFCRRHRRRVNRLSLRQALIPQGAEALPNPVGTAPGVWMRLGHAVLVVLPGVPEEMRAIMAGSVLPRLRRAGRSHAAEAVCSRTLRTIGLVELEIQQHLAALRLPADVAIGLYPHLNTVDVRLTLCGAGAQRPLDRAIAAVRKRLGAAVYGEEEERLEEVVGRLLARKRMTVAVAESCTGGLIGDRLTNVPGSSRYVLLGVTAYHNRIKQDVLGVPVEALRRHGAVSEQVARRMAVGVRAMGDADIGIAVTGIAGPSGGTKQKPVGLVYVAIADRRRSAARAMHFAGGRAGGEGVPPRDGGAADRLAIKMQTASAALDWLRRWAESA